MPKSTPDPTPRGSWATLFHQTTEPIFLLNPRRRIRFVNPAFETLARTPADTIVHEYCNPRKIQKDLPAGRRALLQTLAPPSEVMQGRVAGVRRPVPPARLGPPWWDITFVPLREQDKLIGVLGIIVPVGQPASTAGGKGLSASLIALRQAAVEHTPLSLFEGESTALRRIRRQAELAAKSYAPVWISGQPGAGKETLARAIHYHGVTRERAFATIDCAGLQPYLIRSILFGHNGLAESGRVGTIYLRSAESLPDDLQAELVEWGELLADDCRVAIGVTNGNGLTPEFRAAFGVLDIHLPALCDRRDELPRLLRTVAREFEQVEFSPEALQVLANWHWPGNLRELREIVGQAVLRANGAKIESSHLPLPLRQSAIDAKAASAAPTRKAPPNLDELLAQVERRMIDLAMRKSKGDQTKAADLLGIYRSRLARRYKALGMGNDSTDEPART
jgi:transcriptional regulator with PAS, ATPase and Fis domain